MFTPSRCNREINQSTGRSMQIRNIVCYGRKDTHNNSTARETNTEHNKEVQFETFDENSRPKVKQRHGEREGASRNTRIRQTTQESDREGKRKASTLEQQKSSTAMPCSRLASEHAVKAVSSSPQPPIPLVHAPKPPTLSSRLSFTPPLELELPSHCPLSSHSGLRTHPVLQDRI